jgi:hypothetical protein
MTMPIAMRRALARAVQDLPFEERAQVADECLNFTSVEALSPLVKSLLREQGIAVPEPAGAANGGPRLGRPEPQALQPEPALSRRPQAAQAR